MSIIYILIPIAVLLTAVGIYIFFWAVKTDQFSDLEKQGMSILFDDAKAKNNDINNAENQAENNKEENQSTCPSATNTSVEQQAASNQQQKQK